MRNIDLRAAYTEIYENRFAAHAGKDTDAGAKYAKPTKGGSMKGVYTMKGKDGKPLFDKREEVEAEGEQLDELAPMLAAAAGKLAGAAATKAGTGAAMKAGGGVAKAASSKMGKAALTQGGKMVGNSVEKKLSNEEFENLEEKEGKKDACYHKVKSRYDVWPSAYASGALVKCRNKGAKNWGNSSKKEEFELWVSDLIDEGYDVEDFSEIELALVFEGKKHQDEKNRAGFGGSVRQGSQLPLKNLAPMKRQEAGKPAASDNKGKGMAVKNTVKVPRGTPTQPKRLAKDGPKDFVRGKEHMSKVDMKDPATKKAVEKMANEAGAKKLAKKAAYKNFANKMEKQRRDDLDKRYGPKKEELEAYLLSSGICESEQQAGTILTHMSDDWYETILDELYEGYADNGVSSDEAMKRHGIKKHEGEMKVKKLPARKMRKGEGLGVGARKRQGAGKVSPGNIEPHGNVKNQ